MDTRVNGYVETLKLMKTGLPGDVLRGAYITGPYTLAGLVMGADEAAMATITAPDDLQRLVDVASDQIQSYVRMLIAAGAQVITVLEPTAVMLGPQQFRAFSTAYVSRIAHLARASGAQTVYHTCGDTMHLVEAMVDAGVDGLSLDAPQAGVDLAAAAERTPADVVVMGNLDPTGTLLRGTPGEVQREVKELQSRMAPYPNFILSTGCDLPQETPLENVDAFMAAGRDPIAAPARFDVAVPVPAD
jgi:uroporphyrinogen decarboxylase